MWWGDRIVCWDFDNSDSGLLGSLRLDSRRKAGVAAAAGLDMALIVESGIVPRAIGVIAVFSETVRKKTNYLHGGAGEKCELTDEKLKRKIEEEMR